MAAATATATIMDTKMDVTVVNEFGNVLLKQMVFTWEPIVMVQNRVASMLTYPVTLSSSVEDDAFNPLDTWDMVGNVVVAREYFNTTPVWEHIMKLGQDSPYNPLFENAEQLQVSVFNSQNMTNVSVNLMNPFAESASMPFEVERVDSNEKGWTVSIPSTRYDIMDSITGDMSVSKSEKMYIELYVSGVPDEALLEMQQAYIRDMVYSSNITEYLYVFFIVKDMYNNTVYFTTTW